MKLYILLIIVSIFFPLILSFDKKVHFYKQFKSLFLAIAIIGGFFIIWDIWFTSIGVWGFNKEHLLGINISNLPLEEVLFFIVVPYACIFIHNTFTSYWPIKTDASTMKNLTYVWIGIAFLLGATHISHLYTSITMFLCVITGIILLQRSSEYITNIWRSYAIVVIPFLIINGALTGAFTDTPVVWYNHSENLNFRLFTIPLDDLFYNFTLIVGIIMLRDFFQTKFKTPTS
ncbi:MAG: lycopene cyclase domain-containing protein [Crocinitomicaceae bacterium]